MLEDAPDKVERHRAQLGVFVAVEQRLAPFPEAEMHVHARPVVVENRFGHKRDGLAVLLCYILHDVFVLEDVIPHPEQRVPAHVDFCLAGGCNLVVMNLHSHTDALKC